MTRASIRPRAIHYTQPDLLDAIHTASDGRARPRVDAILTPATTKSMRRRLELAHDRITELTQQNRDLQHQIAVLHGELRTARSNFPS